MANSYKLLVTCSWTIGPLDSESPKYEGVKKKSKMKQKDISSLGVHLRLKL